MNNHVDFKTGFVAIVGRPNVGKSTLLNHLVGQKVSITSRKAQTTRHRINGILTDKQSQIIFVDTPGFQMQHTNRLNNMMNRVVTQSLKEVDVVLFIIEALHFDDRDKLILKLLPKSKPVILVINKIDNVTDKKQLLPFLDEMAKCFTFDSMVPISAEKKIQLLDLLNSIRPHLPQGVPLFDEDDITDRNERFVAAELVREKLFRLMGDEIPYATSVVIEEFKIEGSLRRIHASIIVEKANQKAIVIGKNGEKLKAIGTQARKEMEKFFGGKVFLQIWVKVKSGWADDSKVLRSLGYD